VAFVWKYAKRAHARSAGRRQIELAMHQPLGEKRFLTLSGSRFELKDSHLRFQISLHEFRLSFRKHFELELLATFPD
jgi:hypothetical protein